jgi:CheY-like chemotaxis protein
MADTGWKGGHVIAYGLDEDDRDESSSPLFEGKDTRITTEFEVAASDPQPGFQPVVMIVAAKSVNAHALRELLTVEHRQIEVASAGIEALRLADLIRPDLVLCDLQLPGAPSAYALAQALRSDPALDHAYLVGLTSIAVPAYEEYALRAGFDQVMHQPCDVAVIERLIQALWFDKTGR